MANDRFHLHGDTAGYDPTPCIRLRILAGDHPNPLLRQYASSNTDTLTDTQLGEHGTPEVGPGGKIW